MVKSLLWDLPTRILHWALASSISIVYILDGGDPPHNWVGYAALGFVVLRFIWGMNKKFHRENQLARVIYLLIWGLVIALAITGFMYDTDKYWGEEWLTELHINFSYALLGLIGVHLLGVLIDSVRHGRKTWMGMITGKRS